MCHSNVTMLTQSQTEVIRSVDCQNKDQIFVKRLRYDRSYYNVSEAAKAIGIGRQSMYPYIKMARLHIRPFLIALLAAKKASPNRPILNAYQVWVLAKIRQVSVSARSKSKTVNFIRDNLDLFTLEAFENEQYNHPNNQQEKTSSRVEITHRGA